MKSKHCTIQVEDRRRQYQETRQDERQNSRTIVLKIRRSDDNVIDAQPISNLEPTIAPKPEPKVGILSDSKLDQLASNLSNSIWDF